MLEGKAAKLGTEIYDEERKGKPEIRPGDKPRRWRGAVGSTLALASERAMMRW